MTSTYLLGAADEGGPFAHQSFQETRGMALCQGSYDNPKKVLPPIPSEMVAVSVFQESFKS